MPAPLTVRYSSHFLNTSIPLTAYVQTAGLTPPNRILVEHDLADKAELALGSPVSQTEIEAARRRVLDAFKEEGFAFADVRAVLDFSADRTRARARFVISEGERVYVDGIVIRGAKRTNPSLILRRVSFERCPRDLRIDQCEPYRASAVRKSEERIATLGTFSSVSISLEDPQVPARRKVVVVEVQERVPQYFDLSIGFSTGEGFRTRLEYGHRNVGGEAIQLTLRVQLGYLPDYFHPRRASSCDVRAGSYRREEDPAAQHPVAHLPGNGSGVRSSASGSTASTSADNRARFRSRKRGRGGDAHLPAPVARSTGSSADRSNEMTYTSSTEGPSINT